MKFVDAKGQEREIKIPTSLSGLLRMAAQDCKKTEAAVEAGDFVWFMGTWYEPPDAEADDEYPCEGCMVGAVLYQHDYPKRTDASADDERWMDAINAIRMGNVYGAFSYLQPHVDHDMCDMDAIEARFRELRDQTIGRGMWPPSHNLTWDQYLELADFIEELGY